MEGRQILANGKVPVALGPFHIGTKPTSGSCGSSEWFESLLIAHVLCELLGDPEVVLLTGFERQCFH